MKNWKTDLSDTRADPLSGLDILNLPLWTTIFGYRAEYFCFQHFLRHLHQSTINSSIIFRE